jgi:Neuraminidase (sialidase)
VSARGYCSVLDIERLYGSALTAAQLADADAAREPAEQLVDAATARAWLTGAITGERHQPTGPYLWLRYAPIVSVQAIRHYTRGSTTGTALVPTESYEVDDLAQGRLYFPVWASYAYVQADYTPVATVPAAVRDATAAQVADWLATDVAGAASGTVVRRRVGDVEVQYASDSGGTGGATAALSARARQYLAPYLRVVVFA